MEKEVKKETTIVGLAVLGVGGGSWTGTTAERFSKTVIWIVFPEKASLKPISLTSVLTLL